MSRSDYLYLLSERETVRALLAGTPAEDIIDRYSLEGRLACIEARMQRASVDEAEPAMKAQACAGSPGRARKPAD